MGLIRSSFSFILGTAVGVYIAQNYKVPNVKTLASTALSMANHIEHTYRKPSPNNKDDEQS
ncbi:Short transmembrane mitochondrial protein 1 [Sesbania bispinosa]|nr:Short transmembrane mitochondrial protein 1 [Sesbania bispinosa]